MATVRQLIEGLQKVPKEKLDWPVAIEGPDPMANMLANPFGRSYYELEGIGSKPGFEGVCVIPLRGPVPVESIVETCEKYKKGKTIEVKGETRPQALLPEASPEKVI